MRNDQAKALEGEILSSANLQNIAPINKVVGKGKAQGTYVCKELVYAYAMWISPSFHLKVIRAYDALMTTGIQSVESLSPAVARQIGGMVKAVVHKQLEEAQPPPKIP